MNRGLLKQVNAEESPKLRNTRERDRLLDELNFLESLRKLMDNDDGRRVVLKILSHTSPLSDPVDNSGKVGYRLGKQSVGRWLIEQLNRTGYELNISMFASFKNTQSIDEIKDQIHILQKEISNG